MHLAGFQRTQQWWRGEVYSIYRGSWIRVNEHLFCSVLKFISILDISFKWNFLFLFYTGRTFYCSELFILFLRTLIIKLFSPDIGGNLQNESGKYANCFSSHCVCWKSIVFISVYKTIYLMVQSKIDLSLLVHRCINFMGVHPKVETYWNNS